MKRITLPLLLLACGHAVSAQTGQPVARVPVNQFGAPVLTASGLPINYTQSQLARQEQGFGPRMSAPDAPGTGGMQPQSISSTADWAHFVLGQGIGISNILVSSAGGATEIVVGCNALGSFGGGGNAYWVILRHTAATGGYDQQWVSPTYSDATSVRRMVAADIAPDAGPEIVVARGDGVIEVWNQAARRKLYQFPGAVSPVAGLAVADLDGNGSKEIVVVNNSAGLAVHDAAGALLWRVAAATGTDVVAGQMDADPAIELAVTSGRVVDSAMRAVQWTWPSGFGISLEAADIDNDGMDELIAAEAWNFVWSYDVDRQLPKWSIPVFNVGSIRVGNLDSDPNLELLVGEAQWGDQSVYDTVTQQRQFGIHNPEHGTTDTTFGDVDGDGVLEVIWGAGYSSSGRDQLFVAGITSLAIEWSSVDLGGPLLGPKQGDLDGDGNPEVVVVAPNSDSGYSGARILVFDAATRALRATSAAIGSGFSSSATGFELVNADGDPALEIAVMAGSVGIYNWDGQAAFTRFWELTPSGSPSVTYSSFRLSDLDGDGRPEAIAGGNQFVHVCDFATRAELWRTFYLGGATTRLEVANTDADPAPEIIALSTDGRIYLFDGRNRLADAILMPQSGLFKSMDNYDFPGIGIVFGGDDAGRLSAFVFTGTGYTRLGPIPFRASSLDGFRILEDTPFTFSGAGGVLALHDNFGATPIWSSAAYGTSFGREVIYAEPSRMIMSAGQYGLAGFLVQ